MTVSKDIAKATDSSRIDDDVKLQAVIVYLQCGNAAATSRTVGIPIATLAAWQRSPWWDELVLQIKKEQNISHTSALRGIIAKAVAVTEDRLDNGDWVFHPKTGELLRKPVTVREATNIISTLVTAQAKAEASITDSGKQENMLDHLTKIKNMLEDTVNKKKKDTVVVTDVIFVDNNTAKATGTVDVEIT